MGRDRGENRCRHHPHPAARDCTHRRHGSGHTGAPRGAQGLLLRDASGWPRSREAPGRVQGRAAARLGPRGPSRAGSARTHIPQRWTRQPPAAVAPKGALRTRGPRPRRRRRASSPRAGARPACQLGGRPSAAAAAPFLLSSGFLQPTPRPPRAAAEPVLALPAGRTPPPPLGPRSRLCRPSAASSVAALPLTGGLTPGSPARAGYSGVGGGGRYAPVRLRRPRGRARRGRRAARPRGPGKRRRAWRFPGQPPSVRARAGGGAGRVRAGAALGRACGLRSPWRRLGMSQPGREGPGAPGLIG